jgi:energy-converting hydrogenase A subunit M
MSLEYKELLELNLFVLMEAIRSEYDEPSGEDLQNLLAEFMAKIPAEIKRSRITHEDLRQQIADNFEIEAETLQNILIREN